MPTDALRRALLDHAAACGASGMPRCARIAACLASERSPMRGVGGDPEVLALAALVEIFGGDLSHASRCA